MHLQTDYKTTIHAPVDKVWDALTNPEIVKQYFFGTNLETDWKVGSPILFTGAYEGKTYQDKGIVQEFIPGEKIRYTYLSEFSGLPDKPENYLMIEYQVAATPDGTALTISQSNYDEERAKHSAANWAMVVDGLKKLVE